MPVFNAVGWMLKGGGGKPITPTDMTETDFDESSDGVIWIKIGTVTFNITSLVLTLGGISIPPGSRDYFFKDPDRKSVKVFFKIEQIGGGWSNYYNTNRTVDFTKTSQKISFKKSNFAPKVLESVESHNYSMYLAFKTSANIYKNLDGYDVDFKVTKSK